MQLPSMPQIETPCVKICVMDSAGRMCIGCGRTLDEIARWGSIGEAGRAAIIAALPKRMRDGGLGKRDDQTAQPSS